MTDSGEWHPTSSHTSAIHTALQPSQTCHSTASRVLRFPGLCYLPPSASGELVLPKQSFPQEAYSDYDQARRLVPLLYCSSAQRKPLIKTGSAPVICLHISPPWQRVGSFSRTSSPPLTTVSLPLTAGGSFLNVCRVSVVEGAHTRRSLWSATVLAVLGFQGHCHY